MSGSARILVEDLPQRREDPSGDLGLFGVPPWGGKDQSDPRKRGTPNDSVRNEANFPHRQEWVGRARSPAEPTLGPLVQTKPIALPRPEWTRTGRIEKAPTAANCAKRSQLPRAGRNGRGPEGSPLPAAPGRNVRNKANCPRATRRASTLCIRSYDELAAQTTLAKQSQFPRGQPWTKAGKAAGAVGRTHRAKRSQLAPHRPEEGTGRRSQRQSWT